MKKIGFFDSGMGGISVLKEAVKEMPEESYVYYGDSANAPYGIKSNEEIFNLTMMGVNYLISRDIKALVIACNTATSIAIDEIRRKLDIPVISMEPAIKPALEQVQGKVLVMATPATLNQKRYLDLADHLGHPERLINCPCHMLAGLIEQHLYSEPDVIKKYVFETLSPYISVVEAIVLGCTHYVFIKDMIKEMFPDIEVFDGNHGTVARLRKVLEENGIKEPSGKKGTVVLDSSADDQYTLKTFAWLLNYQNK